MKLWIARDKGTNELWCSTRKLQPITHKWFMVKRTTIEAVGNQ